MKPLSLHRLESLVVEVGEYIIQYWLFGVIRKEVCVQFDIGKAEDLIEVVVFPLLLQLLLHLIENLSALLVFERTHTLQCLADKIQQRVIEPTPLDVYIVTGQRNSKLKFSTLGHVRKFS
jgi:Na+/H+-dicarboxylate symporter